VDEKPSWPSCLMVRRPTAAMRKTVSLFDRAQPNRSRAVRARYRFPTFPETRGDLLRHQHEFLHAARASLVTLNPTSGSIRMTTRVVVLFPSGSCLADLVERQLFSDPKRQKSANFGRSPIRYSISRSARSKIDGGIARPIALAVLRLMTSSNFVGCSIGRSPGFAPFRILST
jgi:hypothetical protein